MGWLFTIFGIAVVAVGLNDVFQTLLHPSGRGRLSHLVVTFVWKFSRRISHKRSSFTGALAVVAVIGIWALLQTIGWALIYYPHIPQGFSYSPGIDESQYADFLEAVYISLVTLATLGYGDVVAVDNWLRLATPLQAITGFGLLTAAVSWFTQIYPALARRRALAIRLSLLRKADYANQLAGIEGTIGSQLLADLAVDIVQVRVDLTQNAETYYFREADAEASLPATISYAVALCEKSQASAKKEIHLGGEVMQAALDDLASFLKSQFLQEGEGTVEVFRSFAEDHGYDYEFSS